MYTDAWTEVDLFRREDLSAGGVIAGPAVIAEANATTVVDPGWQARVTDHSHLMLRRVEARPRDPEATTDVDPVMLELFNNLFMSIAEQMGERLRATANSVNIKEARLLLRALRHRRPSDRQRPAHAGPSGVDGRVHQGGDRGERGADAARRLLRPQQPVPRAPPTSPW